MFALSLLSLVLGIALTCSVDVWPNRMALVETIGGLFLVLGLGLIGFCLPVFR
ncbi:hypothetical protein FOHLNKBM_4865 [Methylobacterium longum]|uniref:hypothetical protein n=1 Tax=Methylobacterium sp. E-046 TaxID=2836576 RepID=UPI001FBC110F|nr:hypothetical protein [Methylobacterium sp. E-046]MCJ2103242.1 hypothetical protein [Methylobacterium sp. E-046]GJE13799.1 hypothetical protein FOHLNKBM_4865 [Methylobacterium longum]